MRRAIPLTYVREALNKNEKIVCVGHFHWFYDIVSWFWLIVGVALAMAIILGCSFYVLHVDIHKAFPDLKDGMESMARAKVIAHYGGWLGLIHNLHVIPKILAAVCVLWGVFTFFHRMVIKYTTEIAVTTQRLMYKQGIVARNVGEMNLARIESIHVWQSLFGRVFNYGHIKVSGIGVGEIILPDLESPMRFRKALDHVRSQLDERSAPARKIDEDDKEADNQG